MKKKDSKNYLDFVPEKNPEIEYEADEDGIITVLIEWKGFYHKIAQKLFRRPRVSDIRLDELGSFVWNAVDRRRDRFQHGTYESTILCKMECNSRIFTR